jgi:hypothetical protein
MAGIEFIFSGGLKLEYLLNGSQAAADWLAMLRKMHPRYLLRNKQNSHHGFATAVEIRRSINRLQLVASSLGFQLDTIDKENWHAELNRLHVHFPSAWGRCLAPQALKGDGGIYFYRRH